MVLFLASFVFFMLFLIRLIQIFKKPKNSTTWEATIVSKKKRNFITDYLETFFTFYILDDTFWIFGKKPQYIFKFKRDDGIVGKYFTGNKEFISLNVGDRIILKKGNFMPIKKV